VRRQRIRIGLIADTHGLLRPEARAFLAGSHHIVHAGDIGEESILEELRAIAPTRAVRGNNDSQPWASRLQDRASITVGEVHLYVIHNFADCAQLPDGVRVVVSGHSHKPRVERLDSVLFVNPGSAGPRRFKLPIAAGELLIEGGSIEARIVDLESGHALSCSPAP
jgi:uncharacterized protein